MPAARPLAAAAVLLALLALLAPGAAAQAAVTPTLTVSVTDPGEDLVPTRPTSLEVLVRYAYGPGGFSNEPISVTLEIVQQPSWTIADIASPVVQLRLDPAKSATGGAVEARTTVNLTLDPSAPARVREEFVLKGTSTARGSLASVSSESPRIGLQAKYNGLLNVTGPESVTLRGGRVEVVTFLVSNVGNGETDVKLRVATKPENSQVLAPMNLTLARGESVEVDVQVRMPWTSRETGFLELEATSVRAAEDAVPVIASVEVLGRAVVPGPGLALLAVAVALAARRR